jgi:hypothetical protein
MHFRMELYPCTSRPGHSIFIRFRLYTSLPGVSFCIDFCTCTLWLCIVLDICWASARHVWTCLALALAWPMLGICLAFAWLCFRCPGRLLNLCLELASHFLRICITSAHLPATCRAFVQHLLDICVALLCTCLLIAFALHLLDIWLAFAWHFNGTSIALHLLQFVHYWLGSCLAFA